MKAKLIFMTILMLLTACAAPGTQPTPARSATAAPQTNMANPAAVYCEQQGYRLENITAADGGQSANCVFPDGSKCDEWAYFRGECQPASQNKATPTPRSETTPTARPTPTSQATISADYQGWWTYRHAKYGFSIMLPEDWVVEEITTADPAMSGHTLNLHPKKTGPNVAAGKENIRMSFRQAGEEVLLWPTGVGQGEFVPQGTLDIGGQAAVRLLLVCPSKSVTSIWYHQAEGQANIVRGNLEFSFIFSATPTHCEAGYSLGGKVQRLGELIFASLKVP
jgi:putative hemolysin